MNKFEYAEFSDSDLDVVTLHFYNIEWNTKQAVIDLDIGDVKRLFDAVFPSDSELEKFNLPANIYLLNQQIDKLDRIMAEYKTLVALANGLTPEQLQEKLEEKKQSAKILDELVRDAQESGQYD